MRFSRKREQLCSTKSSFVCDWTCCICLQISACAFAVSAPPAGKADECHKDELLAAANPNPRSCHSTGECGAVDTSFRLPMQLSHVWRSILCRFGCTKSVIAEELFSESQKGCTLKKCKGPNARTVFLLKLKFENSECLHLI